MRLLAPLLLAAAACGSSDRPPPAPPAPGPKATEAEPVEEPAPGKTAPDPAEARRACAERHDESLRSPEVTAPDLAAAARCFGDAGGVGQQIMILKQVVLKFPAAPEAREALADLGAAYEEAYTIESKAGVNPTFLLEAARHYEQFAGRYSADKRAGSLLIRAACIRHTLDDAGRELERDLHLLRRMRKLPRPVNSGEEACAATPPLPSAP